MNHLSKQQSILFREALHGLGAYSKEEITTMDAKRKASIIAVRNRAQRALNLYKQQRCNQLSNYIFKTLFPKAALAQAIVRHEDTDPEFLNTLSFRDLKIGKEQIINRLIGSNVLTPQFYQL